MSEVGNDDEAADVAPMSDVAAVESVVEQHELDQEQHQEGLGSNEDDQGMVNTSAQEDDLGVDVQYAAATDEGDQEIDPSVEALGRNLDARLATLLASAEDPAAEVQGQVSPQALPQPQPQPVEQPVPLPLEQESTPWQPQPQDQHLQLPSFQLPRTVEDVQRALRQRQLQQLQRLVRRRNELLELEDSTLLQQHFTDVIAGESIRDSEASGLHLPSSGAQLANLRHSAGVGRKGLSISPALFAAATLAASAAGKNDGRDHWRLSPFDLDTIDDEPDTWRAGFHHFLQTPCYKAIVVVMVSVGMGALVHETNQRALNLDVEAWVSYATWNFLGFSLADLALNVFVYKWAFMDSAASVFDLTIVVGDIMLECVALFGESGDNSIAARFRSLRAMRALRGVRACCGCKELDRMVRRMASALRAFIIALVVVASVLAMWAAFNVEAPDNGDTSEGHEYYDFEEVGPAWWERGVDAAMQSLQELLLAVAKVLVLGTDIWEVESLSYMDVEQWTATTFLALVLAMMILKTISDARAEVNAHGIDLDGMPLGWSGGGLDGDGSDEMAEGAEPSLEQLRAILLSVADASSALGHGELAPLLRRRRNLGSYGSATCRELEDGEFGRDSSSGSADQPGGQGLGDSAASASGSDQHPDGVASDSAEVAAEDGSGQQMLGSTRSRRQGRPDPTANAQGFAASRSAAAAAAAAAAGLELTLSAEEMVRAQFAELRREVEREVSWRCGLGPPVAGGGLFESAAEGATRWLYGLSTQALDPSVWADGVARGSTASAACEAAAGVSEDTCSSATETSGLRLQLNSDAAAAHEVAHPAHDPQQPDSPMVNAAFLQAESGSSDFNAPALEMVRRWENEPPILALF